MSLLLPANARGPILDLALPTSEPSRVIVLRNKTTGKTLKINLPEEWNGDDLSLDFRLRTILDQSGADRSALLDATDNELWTPGPLIAGANDVEIEATGPALVAQDDFNQTAGAVTGKALETGGTWEGEGDTDDFSVVAGSEHLLRRSAVSDAGSWKGRLVKASTPNVAATRTLLDFGVSAGPSSGQHVFASVCGRIIAGGVRVEAFVQWINAGASELLLFLLVREGGLTEAKVKILGETGLLTSVRDAAIAGQKLRLILECVGGEASAQLYPVGEPTSSPLLSGKHEWLEGKGSKNLSKGKVGAYDANTAASAPSRNFDRFRAYDLTAKASYAAKATLRWEQGYY